MGLEVFDFIPELVPTNPEATDPVAQGDDHIRGIKLTLQNQWPLIGSDAVTRTALQMNDAALRSEANTFTQPNTFTAQILADNGSVTAPGYAFFSDPKKGMFGNVADTILFTVLNTERLRVNANGITVTGEVSTAGGVAATPAYNFTGDAGKGMFSLDLDRLGFSVNSVLQMELNTQNAIFQQPILGIAGSASFPSYSFIGDTTTGMFRDTPNRISFASAGNFVFLMQSDQIQALASMRAVDGSAAAPGYGFTNTTDMGMFRGGAGLLNFTVDGTELFSITAAGIIHNAVSSNQSGTAAAPGITFNTVRDMGFNAISTSVLGFATGGTERARISSSGFDTAVPLLAQNENTITRPSDTQARTGWRYTNAANQPQWAIYLGTTPNNTLAFQRYNSSGTFQDIPLSINQAGGIIRMSTLPTSSAGLVAGELWRNPVSPGFVAII